MISPLLPRTSSPLQPKIMATTHLLELTEYQPQILPQMMIPHSVGKQLWQDFDQKGKRILVDFPSPKTSYQWVITPQGWVGHAPVTDVFHLVIQPKTRLDNLFRMWEVAYQLRSANLLPGLIGVQSIAEFYEQLALWLAQKVLLRSRQGFHAAYLPHEDKLPYVRGQLVPQMGGRKPTSTKLLCRYDTFTTDIPDNQILAHTLDLIARSRRCRPEIQTAVRRASQQLQQITTPHPITPADCQNRTYTRLNRDYQPLHALCRFFLEHTGPQHQHGIHEMMPFLINMPRLFELFIANWLRENLPANWSLQAQETVTVGSRNELRFDIDLVLYDGMGRVTAVLDAKYKTPDKPSQQDISQIVTYAKAKKCQHAFLIYPGQLTQPLHIQFDDLTLHTLTFPLDQPIHQAGAHFLAELLLTLPEQK